jgi:hypothetical protein
LGDQRATQDVGVFTDLKKARIELLKYGEPSGQLRCIRGALVARPLELAKKSVRRDHHPLRKKYLWVDRSKLGVLAHDDLIRSESPHCCRRHRGHRNENPHMLVLRTHIADEARSRFRATTGAVKDQVEIGSRHVPEDFHQAADVLVVDGDVESAGPRHPIGGVQNDVATCVLIQIGEVLPSYAIKVGLAVVGCGSPDDLSKYVSPARHGLECYPPWRTR